jgi:hypothetical protein
VPKEKSLAKIYGFSHEKIEGSMVRVEKKKRVKGQQPKRLTVVQCWVNTGSGTR